MFGKLNIEQQLNSCRLKQRKGEEQLLAEARHILKKDLFRDDKVLRHLLQYNRTFDVLNEEEVNAQNIFTPAEIREVATKFRLKFLESRFYKSEFPYEAILQIKELNRAQGKDLKIFRVMAAPEFFKGKRPQSQCSLFVKTDRDNYYLLYRWGSELPAYRSWIFWPLKSFETLAFSVIFFTLCLTLVLPTELITLDRQAEYWSGYRAATFFHLLIFDTAVSVYFTFAFALNFSNSVWNRARDFD